MIVTNQQSIDFIVVVVFFVLKQVDENMTEFRKWLDNYLSTFNDNVHSFFQE